jgi:steroid delta-isomerase-like uncharacterized protein
LAVEENKELARRFFLEFFNTRSQTVGEEIVADDFVTHHPASPDGIPGRDGALQFVDTFRDAFPDLEYAPEDVIGSGDKVAVRWIAHGTHMGEFQGLPPTGKRIAVTGIDIFRVAEGKIREAWVSSDLLGLLRQIGALQSVRVKGA